MRSRSRATDRGSSPIVGGSGAGLPCRRRRGRAGRPQVPRAAGGARRPRPALSRRPAASRTVRVLRTTSGGARCRRRTSRRRGPGPGGEPRGATRKASSMPVSTSRTTGCALMGPLCGRGDNGPGRPSSNHVCTTSNGRYRAASRGGAGLDVRRGDPTQGTETPHDFRTVASFARHLMIWAPRWLTALVVAPAPGAHGRHHTGSRRRRRPSSAQRSWRPRPIPGVQLIQADFTSTISVPQAIIDRPPSMRLYTPGRPGGHRRDQHPPSPRSSTPLSQSWPRIPSATSRRPTPGRRSRVGLSGFGTGFVVNAEGYLVTAAHVIAPDPDELKVEFARAGLRDLIANDLDEVQASGVAYNPANLDTLAPGLPGLVRPLPRGGRGEHDGERPDRRRDGGVDKTSGDSRRRSSRSALLPGQDVAVLQAGRCGRLPPSRSATMPTSRRARPCT